MAIYNHRCKNQTRISISQVFILTRHYQVFACAILPTHVHLVVAVHTNPPRRIIGHFKARATQSLNREGIHPLENQASPWSVKGWAVFLDTDDEVFRAIEYVNKNPIKEGLPPQRWKFVVPYVPW